MKYISLYFLWSMVALNNLLHPKCSRTFLGWVIPRRVELGFLEEIYFLEIFLKYFIKFSPANLFRLNFSICVSRLYQRIKVSDVCAWASYSIYRVITDLLHFFFYFDGFPKTTSSFLFCGNDDYSWYSRQSLLPCQYQDRRMSRTHGISCGPRNYRLKIS